ncbi:MAG: hypothetical protein IKU64_00390 [Bacteroides sp.]|nr:hypothetical protein [Bacteroides sp.]
MMTTQISLDKMIVDRASAYAAEKGENLSLIIERFLLNLIQQNPIQEKDEKVPDIVLSLLGAGNPVAENDINGREAYHQYMEEKYK